MGVTDVEAFADRVNVLLDGLIGDYALAERKHSKYSLKLLFASYLTLTAQKTIEFIGLADDSIFQLIQQTKALLYDIYLILGHLPSNSSELFG